MDNNIVCYAVLVVDNHPAHGSDLFMKAANDAGYQILYLSTSTSIFNPIEKVWAIFKRNWGNFIVLNRESIKSENLANYVNQQMGLIKGNVITNLSKNDRKAIMNVLSGVAV